MAIGNAGGLAGLLPAIIFLVACCIAFATGTFYCNGKQEDFTWERGDYSDNFHYYKLDGTPLEFGVGKTYICVISTNDTVELY